LELSFVDDARHITEQLIRFATPSQHSNEAVTDWLEAKLHELGFRCERIDRFDSQHVKKCNIVACREPLFRTPPDYSSQASSRDTEDGASLHPGVAYFAHTDVVPAETWDGPGGPFDPVVADNRLYGRGSCDMKGSLAAMLAAIRRIPHVEQKGTIWLVCTADEEIGFGGAKNVRQHSQLYRQMVAAQPFGIIGEPTRLHVMHAHKGISGIKLVSRGRAAHSSTRDGHNATLAMIPVMQEMLRIYHETEQNPDYHDERFDPPTLTWNFGFANNIDAINVTPALCRAWASWRTMPGIDAQQLVDGLRNVARQQGVEVHEYEGGSPLWVDAQHPWVQSMCRLANRSTPETVSYCTDAGQFTEIQALVVCGPGDIAQAHTSDEFIDLDQLAAGVDLYEKVLRTTCT
jgi:acetylornithine deacetylase